MSIVRKIAISPLFTGIDRMEDDLFARVDSVHPNEDSPVRFEITKELLKREKGGPPKRMLPIMMPTLFGIRESLGSLEENPAHPKTHGDRALFEEIEARAIKLGASSVGYTRVPPQWVFQKKAIAFDNAIMLTMEMDKGGIDSAPSIDCMKTVMETYRDLGRIANKIADSLRVRGYGAHAGHPLNGLALYPPLAQSAGLGWIGLNGIIITPEHGPRVRLAAVFTSIKNLPITDANEHGWVVDYCTGCKVCLKKCPPKALYDTPVDHGNGRITYVDNDLCFPYFSDFYGCSVCVSVCPFNHVPYKQLKEKFNKKFSHRYT